MKWWLKTVSLFKDKGEAECWRNTIWKEPVIKLPIRVLRCYECIYIFMWAMAVRAGQDNRITRFTNHNVDLARRDCVIDGAVAGASCWSRHQARHPRYKQLSDYLHPSPSLD